MTDTSQLIETCKREIANVATCANLDWREEDIISAHDDTFGDVVFLLRFNPHDAIDEDGKVVMRDGKPVIAWTYTMWLEDIPNVPHLEFAGYTDNGKPVVNPFSEIPIRDYVFRYNMPRLVCIAP